MADQRTFTLIGNFTDNITPALDKINKSIDSLKKNLDNLSSVTKPLKTDFRQLASLSKNFSQSLQGQAKDIRDMTSAMKAFRAEMGRTNRAYKAGGSRFTRGGRTPTLPQAPTSLPPLTPTGRRGGRGGGGGYSAAVAGGILGTQLSSVMTGAIVSGFQMGTALMMKPFQYFQQALGERINDEMSDLRAAGGFFAIAKRQKDPFVTTMDEAIQYTQKNNQVLAKLASALPGSTQDYIEVSKRLSDTITRVVSKDLTGAIKEANKLRATPEGAKFYGKEITGTGRTAQQEAITTLLANMTKKTVLAGFGGRTGAGGAMGPYGLPGLTERLISQDQVSVGQFQRYAAIFSDPQILDALTRNIDKVNATGKDSIERYKALDKLYDEILPPELIAKFRRSIKGINEALYSAALNPEVGFLGLGRKLEGLGRQMNDLGQYVDSTGKVVSNVNQAARVNLSIFELLRDIYAQTAQVLTPLVEYLPLIWDPLKKIGAALSDARHFTGQFLRTYNGYRNGFIQFAKSLKGAREFKIMESLDVRSSLMAITNMLMQVGAIDMSKFTTISKQLMDPNANLGNVITTVIQEFFSSKAAENLGKFLGNLIGTVLRQVADATKYVSGVLEGGGFAGGFASSFKKAGGFSAIQDIFVSLIKLFFKALGTAITEMPLLTGTVAALALLPTIIGAGVTNLVERCMGSIAGAGCALSGPIGGAAKSRKKGLARTAAGFIPGTPRERVTRMRGMQAYGQAMGRKARGFGVTTQARAFGGGQYASPIGPLTKAFAKGPGGPLMASGLRGLPKALQNIKEFGVKALPFAKKLPGLSIALAALDFGLRKAGGESTAVAAGGAIGAGAGGVLGGVLGSALGPAGTVAGGVLGAWLGDWLGSNIGRIIQDLPSKLSSAWSGFQNWIQNAPYNIGFALGKAKTQLETAWSGMVAWWNGLGPWWSTVMTRAAATFKGQMAMFGRMIAQAMSGQINWGALASTLATNIGNMIKSAVSSFMQGFRAGQVAGKPGTPPPAPPPAPRPRWNGGWGDAIAEEMKHKPAGSQLVLANSSETIIPAGGSFLPKMNKMTNAIAEVRYGMGKPAGGASKNWMQILDEDYKKNLNKPYNPSGTVKNSGRGGLDTWGGPEAYISPKSLAPVASAGGGGGPVNVNSPITIHQQPGQNAEELAAIVAMKIGDAVAEAKASSMFV